MTITKKSLKSRLILVISLFLEYLQINGVNLLSVEYDRMNHTESILNKDSQNILWIMYDDSGLPVQFLPCSDHHAMNITYNQRGQITHWQYGEMWEKKCRSIKLMHWLTGLYQALGTIECHLHPREKLFPAD